MQMECKYCRYAYEYERYGTVCPQCGVENQPFRSAGARVEMGFEETGEGYFGGERREAAARAGDPMYGKSFLQRLRPYLMILAIALSVGILGSSLMRFAREAQGVPPAPLLPDGGVRPPIAELAEAMYDISFPPAGGRVLKINAAGRVPETARAGEAWFFVDFSLTVVERAAAERAFVPPVAVCGDAVALPEYPQEAWMANYTPLAPEKLEQELSTSGQIFYRLPEDARQIQLFYRQEEEKQKAVLELPG